MKKSVAVLMMAYGGPDSLEDVEPYLLDVRHGRATSADLVEEIKHRYAQIGGKSPLLEITLRQAHALEQALNADNPNQYRVFVGMRHWKPYIREVMADIKAAGSKRIIALCMTAFYSRISTGAYFDQLDQALAEHYPSARPAVHRIEQWFDAPGYVNALAAHVREGIERIPAALRDDITVLFSAHSLPAALADQGDPYHQQFHHLAQQVAGQVGLQPSQWRACYQSAGAQNTRWLGPPIEEVVHDLADQGKRAVLVAPIGFLADHVEILFDIDIELRGFADQLGLYVDRTCSLNDDPLFIAALANIIQQESHRVFN